MGCVFCQIIDHKQGKFFPSFQLNTVIYVYRKQDDNCKHYELRTVRRLKLWDQVRIQYSIEADLRRRVRLEL